MKASSPQEREVRAARNQSLFRAVNENLRELNEAFTAITRTFTIACECADSHCVEMIEIEPHAYEAVRAQPRCFAVIPTHVLPDVEVIVRESGGQYVVVEKVATAGEAAEVLEQETSSSSS